MRTRDETDLRRTSIRLAVQFGAVSVAVIATLIGVTFSIVGASQSESVTETLVESSHVQSVGDASDSVLVAISADGDVSVSRNAPRWFPDTSLFAAAADSDQPILTTETHDGHTYRVRTDADPGRIVQTALDTAESSEELGRLGLALGISGAIATIAAVLLAMLMARRAMRPMVEALALQRRFVMDASHELRTPLTLLSTRAQLLRRELTDRDSSPGIRSGLDEILQDSGELTGILEDLLVAADPRETMVKVPLDLVALAREAVAALRLQAETAGVGLELAHALGGEPVTVEGARIPLLRLFTSLISNAIDHAESLVVVDVRSKGGSAEIRVRDDGDGFPEAMRARAFERFATSRAAPGTGSQNRHYGLGLALVAEVAARHDGTVTVESSSAEKGAVILVTLPTRSS